MQLAFQTKDILTSILLAVILEIIKYLVKLINPILKQKYWPHKKSLIHQGLSHN